MPRKQKKRNPKGDEVIVTQELHDEVIRLAKVADQYHWDEQTFVNQMNDLIFFKQEKGKPWKRVSRNADRFVITADDVVWLADERGCVFQDQMTPETSKKINALSTHATQHSWSKEQYIEALAVILKGGTIVKGPKPELN